MKKLIAAFALLLPLFAGANEGAQLERAPIDPNDQASLQRGAKVFINYCLNCHSAAYMRYNRLKDIGLSDAQIKANLLFAGEKVGDTMTAAMSKKDAKTWFGVPPPDLTVEARARGADWLYAYMRGFYRDNTTLTGWNNTVFDKVAMPHILWQLQGQQVLKVEEKVDAQGIKTQSHTLVLNKPGILSPVEYDATVADLVNYMAYMAEPAQNQRKHLGLFVLLFLGLFFILTYYLKKEFWKDIH
jgi:ubiquinol-cytochrome c reductase cytochrome c1 subunit